MSRGLTPAAAAASVGNPGFILLVELDFQGGPVRAHSGVGDFEWNGNTFTGVGTLGKVSEIEEGKEMQAYGLQLQLSGIPSELLSISLNGGYRGRSASLWVAFLDDNHQLINDPVGPFSGTMNTMDGELGETATITLSVESRLVDWERPRIRRYNDGDQQAVYPGDLGLEFVPQMVEKELIWGVG